MSSKTRLVKTVLWAGIVYYCLLQWFLVGKEKQMTDQIQREPDGEALNVTSSGSLTAWLETTAIPVK